MPQRKSKSQDKSIHYWLESSGITNCPTCGSNAIYVPYGGHQLSRIWNRIDKIEMLMCCRNSCFKGQKPFRKIRRL